MALDPSYVATLNQALFTNASYEEDGSIAEARAFITAARRLLALRPQMSSKDKTSVSFSPKEIENQIADARLWIASQSGGSFGNRHFSLENLRDRGGGNISQPGGV